MMGREEKTMEWDVEIVWSEEQDSKYLFHVIGV
jgi:hypothetical protein